jgi:type I restriction enzyme R subunit
MKVAPLLRFVPDVNMAEAFFTSKMERAGLALLQRKELDTLAASIREDVDLLPATIARVQEQAAVREEILSNRFWSAATLKTIDSARKSLAPLMKYKRDRPSLVIELGLDDVIDSRKWVVVRKEGLKMMVEEYRKKVEEKIEQLAATHPTIQLLKKGQDVNTLDLVRLEETLEAELGTDELNLNEDNILKAFGVRVGSLTDFLRHVLKLESLPSYEQIVRKAFDAFILEHNYNADQTRFLRTVQTVFLQKRKLEEADLYEAPFTNFGANAVEKLFKEDEIGEMMKMVKRLAA